jgi:hypothetical protein
MVASLLVLVPAEWPTAMLSIYQLWLMVRAGCHAQFLLSTALLM